MRFVLLSLLCATAAYAQTFIPYLPDIPLPENAESEPVLDFDTEDTHLSQVMIYAPTSADSVQQFYAETLPQLGWQSAGSNRFVRDADTLTLEPLSSKKGATVWRLELKASINNP